MTFPFFNQTLPLDDIQTSQHHVVILADRTMLLLDHRVSTVFINQSGNQSAELSVCWSRIAVLHLKRNTRTTAFEIDVQIPFLLPILKTAPGNVHAPGSHVDKTTGRSIVIGSVNDRQHEPFIFGNITRARRIISGA